MEKGTIFKFHNDLDTDQIIASQYLLLPNLDEMKARLFYNVSHRMHNSYKYPFC